MIPFLVLSVLIIINIALSPFFSPTWDFPEHLYDGLVRLGMVVKPGNYQYLPYGYINDALPILFFRLFPQSWFPTSYNLFSVVIGCIGLIFFYLLVKDGFGKKVALLSSITLFLLPRFIGYLHVDIKDSVTASFLIITAFFFNRYLTRWRMFYAVFSILFYTCAVNTKITAFQFYPVLVVWMLYDILILKHRNEIQASPRRRNFSIAHVFLDVGGFGQSILSLIDRLSFVVSRITKLSPSVTPGFILLFLLLLIPIAVFFLLWPGSINDFINIVKNVNDSIYRLPYTADQFYALTQFFVTTPLPILAFAPFGIWAAIRKVHRGKDSVSFFLLFLFFWTFLKYPLLRSPVIDNVRYFLEVFYPLVVFFVLGVGYIAKKYATLTYLGVFLFCLYLLFMSYPYQINYYNALAVNRDPDFWAASYKEAIGYVNKVAPKDATVSCHMAELLAQYYLRSDLREKLNTKPPEQSDVVVILNRPSVFPLFRLSEYFERNKPRKVITDREGTPLTYIYY